MAQTTHPGIDLFLKDIAALPPGHFLGYKKDLVIEVFGTVAEAHTWCADRGATLFMDADDELVNIGVPNVGNNREP